MSDEPFKVAIVGGGYTGLATALHLEILGIDWVLIEAHDVIAPQLGASVGLAPNGMAIIDQLGCLEDVEKRSTACRSAQMRNGEGKIMYSFAVDPIRQIHGYDLTFTERRIVLEVLYDHIKSKDKIFTGQKVQSIEHAKDGVEIYTQEGRTFTADLVVGADGIHSHVRGQMWKAAWNDGSTAFSKQVGQDVETEYGCVFGLSNRTNDLKEGQIYQVHTFDRMLGLVMGQNDDIYWFHFFRAPKKHTGMDLPRYTEKDVERLLAEDGHRIVKDGTTFNDIFNNRKTHVITPLPTHTFQRWHYKRIICLGDAVAKFQPIQGQGGCMALESTAAFVDQLYNALEANNMQKLSAEQVESVFTKAAEVRLARTKKLVGEGLTFMRFASWSNWIFRFIDSYIVGLIPHKWLASLMFAGSTGAYKSTTLPAPSPVYERSKDKKV
ncbi:unnamed protein product [Clonostachys solani]|uniref:FAD-binding domain-containing protein n=1 Tax=Clonostachys solani TaxID=160281 RepID=A0A9N9ZNX2_9HYPO|nr:unnamed protein product [Clonostachys solani]